MTKTLTEQWREGKLPAGLYYIEGKGSYDIALIRNIFNPVLTNPYCEEDVFEPDFVPVDTVPSYYEYIELVSKIEQLEKRLEVSEKAHYKTLELLRIATKALKELEMKSDILYRGRNDWTIVEQLDFIKAKSRETLYKIKEMEGVK